MSATVKIDGRDDDDDNEKEEEEEKIEREEDTAGNNYIPNTELNTSHALFNFFLLILR